MIRELLANSSPHPGFAKWLKNKDLIRISAAVINNIANGESPAAHLDFLLPAEEFKIIRKNDKIYVDPRSYKRYNRAAAIFSSLDSAVIMSLYRQAKPLIEEAFKDLGFPREEFDDTLRRAITILLQVPVIEKKIELEEKVTTYALKDPALEKLTPAQKHLLRMGPGNTKKIQAKLKEISDQL
ncbi:MAG: DUF3014 domain-containing protein [Candidatus Aminicenantes bacterium]|nr:DUF3014 domain-containing protein [Candidatus Aminicenantes bacterium]